MEAFHLGNQVQQYTPLLLLFLQKLPHFCREPHAPFQDWVFIFLWLHFYSHLTKSHKNAKITPISVFLQKLFQIAFSQGNEKKSRFADHQRAFPRLMSYLFLLFYVCLKKSYKICPMFSTFAKAFSDLQNPSRGFPRFTSFFHIKEVLYLPEKNEQTNRKYGASTVDSSGIQHKKTIGRKQIRDRTTQ